MPFEYVGLQSLATPGVLDQVLISSVEDTGLVYDFKVRGSVRNMSPVVDYFQRYAFLFLSGERLSSRRAMVGIAALGIHSVAMHRIFENGSVFAPDKKIIGIHEAAIRKNPTKP